MSKMYDTHYLHLLSEITVTQFKLKDQSTFFGFIWSFLHPLIMLSILFIFFSYRMGGGIKHYAIYLLIGITHYTQFANSTNSSMIILQSRKELTNNTIFPKEVLVIGLVLANAVEFILSMSICVVIAYLSGVPPSWSVITLPIILLIQLMLVLGGGLFLSWMYIFIKDVGHIYRVFLRLLFFITPIFYHMSFLGEGPAKYIALLNPLTHLINFSRTIIIQGEFVPSHRIFGLFLLSMVFIYFSLKVFKQFESKFAEHL